MLKMLACLFLFGAIAFPTLSARADEKKADHTHAGFVVSTSDGMLVMADKEGKKEHTHKIAATTTITLNDKAAKLDELKKGDAVTVTTGADGEVTAVAATRKE